MIYMMIMIIGDKVKYVKNHVLCFADVNDKNSSFLSSLTFKLYFLSAYYFFIYQKFAATCIFLENIKIR